MNFDAPSSVVGASFGPGERVVALLAEGIKAVNDATNKRFNKHIPMLFLEVFLVLTTMTPSSWIVVDRKYYKEGGGVINSKYKQAISISP